MTTDTERDYNGETPNGWGWNDDAMVWREDGAAIVSVPFATDERYEGRFTYVAAVDGTTYGPFTTLSDAITGALRFVNGYA